MAPTPQPLHKARDGATLNVPKEETGRRGGGRGGPFSRVRVGECRRVEVGPGPLELWQTDALRAAL